MAAIDLFNPLGATKEERKDTDKYIVTFKDGKNGIYRSVIRFIPYYADPMRSTMIKTVTWVKNPITQKGMYIDDPRSVDKYSPLTEMYFNLRNTGIASYVEWAKTYIGSKKQYASLVQIMADEQHPELVGQIRVFVYGKKVYDKLNNEAEPQGVGQEGINPFHPIYGRKFSLICTNQSNFNNFDQSSFFDERNGNQIMPSGMWYIDPAKPDTYSIVDENTDPEVLMEYLQKNSPDLSKYDYHDWTEEQTQHVEEVLTIARNMLNSGSMVGQPVQTTQAYGSPTTPQPQFNPTPSFPGATPQQPVTPTSPITTPQVGITQTTPIGVSVPQQPTAPTITGVTPPQKTTPPNFTPQVAPPSGGGMNMDDILAQL